MLEIITFIAFVRTILLLCGIFLGVHAAAAIWLVFELRTFRRHFQKKDC